MPSLKKYKKGIKKALKVAKREAGTFRLGFKKPVMETRLGF